MRASNLKGRVLLGVVLGLVFIPVFWAMPAAANPCVSSYDAQTIAANLAASANDVSTDARMTALTTCAGDDVSYQIPLTATVMFDGHAYTNVFATTNSVITFGAPDGTYWDYPGTPSISLYSMDWLSIPAVHPDEHLIIQTSDGGFQVDLSARPYGSYWSTADATDIVITAAINVDGTVAMSFATSGPTYDYARTGVRLTDGSVVSLEQYGVVQTLTVPTLAPTPQPTATPEPTPEPVVTPTPTPTPTPTVEPSPTPEPTITPAPIESPSSEPVATPEPIPAPVTEDVRTEDVRTVDVRPVEPTTPPIVPIVPVVPVAPEPAVEPTPSPTIEQPAEPTPVPADSSPIIVPETPAAPAPAPQPEPAPTPAPEPTPAPTPQPDAPSAPSAETTPTTPAITPPPQPTPKTPQTSTPTVAMPPTPKPVEPPPVEQPKPSTPSVPSLPDNATPAQVAEAINGANEVLATATPDSPAYQEALNAS